MFKKKAAEIEKELNELSARLEELNNTLSEPQAHKDKDFVSLNKEYKKLKEKDK